MVLYSYIVKFDNKWCPYIELQIGTSTRIARTVMPAIVQYWLF